MAAAASASVPAVPAPPLPERAPAPARARGPCASTAARRARTGTRRPSRSCPCAVLARLGLRPRRLSSPWTRRGGAAFVYRPSWAARPWRRSAGAWRPSSPRGGAASVYFPSRAWACCRPRAPCPPWRLPARRLWAAPTASERPPRASLCVLPILCRLLLFDNLDGSGSGVHFEVNGGATHGCCRRP